MSGPSDVHPDTLDRRLAALEQRLTLLERTSTTLSRSALADPDDADAVTVELGELTTQSDLTNKDSLEVDGTNGLGVYRWDGNERTAAFRVSDTKGLEAPLVYTSWRKTTTVSSVNVTSASYQDVWHVDLPTLDTDTLSMGWYADVPAGTTAKWEVDLYGAAYSTSERTTTGAGLEWFDIRWQHGMPTTAWPASWGIRVRVRCYRSAGAGTIVVREPTALALGHTEGASADGWYN